MITPSDAVKKSHEYLMRVSPNSERYTNFRVEELKNNTKEDYLVTLSYEVSGEFGFDKTREYKDFIVNKEDGKITSMMIRKI